MNATAVLARIRKAARAKGFTVEVKAPRRGSHHKVTVNGHCATTLAMHPGDIPTGTLNKIRTQLEHCLGKGWL